MLGSMIFGSYIKDKKANILKQATIVSGSIVAAGLAAGMMIFPMVFAFGLEPGAGTGLTMITLPNVFNYITGGKVIGTLFYVGFYFAALSSAIGLAEAISAVFMDLFHISRKRLSLLSWLFCSHWQLLYSDSRFLGCGGRYYKQLSAGHQRAFLIDIFVAWIWGADNFLDAIHIKKQSDADLAQGFCKVSLSTGNRDYSGGEFPAMKISL